MMRDLLINAYYSKWERKAFIKNVLLPLRLTLQKKGLLENMYFLTSYNRGEHLKLYFKLNTDSAEWDFFVLDELQKLVHLHPSNETSTTKGIGQYFKPFPVNTVHKAIYDNTKLFTAMPEVNVYVEKLANTCCKYTMEQLATGDDIDILKVGISLSDAVFNGLKLETDKRTDILNSFMKNQFSPPPGISDKDEKKEILNQAKEFRNRLKKEFSLNKNKYRSFLVESRQDETAACAKLVEGISAEILLESINLLNKGAFKLTRDFKFDIISPLSIEEQSLSYVISVIFTVVMDGVLVHEENPVAIAYFLNELYTEKTVSVG